MTSKPRRLHPAAILFFFNKDIKNLFIPVAIFAFAVFQQAKTWTIIGLIAFFILVVAGDVVRYMTFSYQFFDKEILVHKGIFIKKVNHIPYDRIQNVTTNQWFFLKPFKLEELEIETAGHSEGPEVSLVAVPVELKDELNSYRHRFSSEVTQNVSRETFSEGSKTKQSLEATNVLSYSITWRELIKFALTSPAFLSGLLVVLAIYGKVQNGISNQMYKVAANEFAQFGWVLLVVVMIVIVLLFYVLSVFALIAKYYHFHLTKENGQFEMRYGFFKTKRTNISESRIQAVVVKQTLLRSFLHISSVKLVIISNSNKEETEKDIIVMPVIETAKLNDFFKKFFPHIPVEELKQSQSVSGTFYYDLRNAAIFSLVIDLVVGMLFYRISWLLVLLLIAVSAVILLMPAYLNARRARLSIMNGQYLFLQNNQVTSKNSYFVPKNSIQLVERRQSIWLSKKKFAHIRLSCRSGIAERILQVKYLPEQQVDGVVEWYKK
ncbi:PH domain-containing protein [Companilactobacillus hulinensis]|uniref:PH domain-containing protein n=1 Tax=Companilactobacillus hulinensis TaxID=2486007 RepID=UPI000F770585|nr:PH domain-containing protein [Companilactobacillus hulinensis]